MIKKAKNLLGDDKYKKMVSNFSYLSLINIANKVLPLIVIPYIVATIGVEKYGVIIFAYAVMQYFLTITRYSFDLTATKYISIHRENLAKISDYFWNVITTRLLLFGLGLIILLPIIFGIDKFHDEKEVFLFAILFVFANDLIPLWFFQGVEDMKYIAIFNVATKLLYAIAIFIVVKEQSDYIYVPLINSISFLLVGIYSIYFIIKKYKIKFIKPTMTKIKELLDEGKDIFISNVSVSFYTHMNTVLLGLLTNYNIVGIYGLAETLWGAFEQIIKVYTAVIYPHLARYADDTKKLYMQARKFFNLYLAILVASSLFLFLSAGFIMELLFGAGHEDSILVLRILSIAILFEPLGGFFTGYLAIKSEHRIIRKITFQTMLVNFVLIIPFILLWEEVGVAVSFLILEMVQVYLNLKHNMELIGKRKHSE